jgi:two-component system, OmpR family, response regulator
MANIFLLEDDHAIGEAIQMQLESKNFNVSWAKTINEAKNNQTTDFQVYLLDINLPDGNGIDYCKYLRQKGVITPIIFVTAIDDEDSVVYGLSHGANDYIRKPFGYKELIARVHAQIGSGKIKEEYITLEDLKLNENTQTLHQRENSLFLNRREFFLLKVLISNPDIVLTREKLIEYSLGNEDIVDRTIDSHISHIRKKLAQAGIKRLKISSVYGSGYILSVEK